MRNRKSKAKTILLVGLCIVIFFIGVAYSALKQDLNIVGRASLTLKEEQDYEVTYVIVNTWYANERYFYQIQMQLKNNTNTVLNGWKIDIKAPENATLVTYSSVICNLEKERITFTPVSYNTQVPAKGSISFEFQVSTTDPYYKPGDIIINGGTTNPPAPEPPINGERRADIKVKMENSWTVGEEVHYQYAVTITNIGELDIYSWQFSFKLHPLTHLEQIWSAVGEEANRTLMIKNSTYNGIIPKENSISFGFILKSKKTPELVPIDIILK